MVTIAAMAPLFPEILSLHGRWQPARPALIAGGETLTWAEFEAATNRVANGLRALGIGPGDMVAVLMTNGRAMVEVLFGIMKAGACSVPINLAVADPSAAAMITDSGARAVFATAAEAARVDAMSDTGALDFDGKLIGVGTRPGRWTDYAGWAAGQATAFPDLDIPPDAACNVIYSSGTTGQPKGILHSHKGRLDWAYDVALAFNYHADARTLLTLGLYSNIMWVAMLCTLLAGGTLIVHEGFDPARALKDIEDLEITHTAMVPVQFGRLLEAGASRRGLRSMVSVITVGSKMQRDLKLRVLKVLPQALFELYGLTEGIITVQTPAQGLAKPDSVGRPIVGCDIVILGDDDRVVDAGTCGEIVGRARYVMPGYLNRDEATAAALWTDDRGRHWLRTGDIGYLDTDGALFIVDRKKDMILSGGQNIYPQDIEDVLAGHGAVGEVAVIGAKSRKWGETPIALVVPGDGAPSPDELRDWCNRRVGRQQRIAEVIYVAELPRNPNGKLLKRQLRLDHGGRQYD